MYFYNIKLLGLLKKSIKFVGEKRVVAVIEPGTFGSEG